MCTAHCVHIHIHIKGIAERLPIIDRTEEEEEKKITFPPTGFGFVVRPVRPPRCSIPVNQK